MSTAPTLTWQQTQKRAPVDPTVVQDVLDALALAVGDSTEWEVVSSAANELEIRPVTGSPVTAMRVLFATAVNSAQVPDPHDTAVGGVLYMGLAPDGGTLGDAHGAGNPYGAARWSGYWKISGVITGADPCDWLHTISSKEVFSVWLQESTPEDWRGGIVGCIIDPPTDADGEGTPGRVYGMLVSGTDLISNGFWNQSNEFVNSSGSGQLDAAAGCFRPNQPNIWARVEVEATSLGLAAPRHQTEGGTRVTWPVPMNLRDSPHNHIGVLRQMRKAQDGKMRGIVQDSGEPPADYSYHVTGDSTADTDCLSFDNG